MEELKGPKFNKFISDNRKRTLKYLQSKYTKLSFDDIEDIYQESSIALFNNIKTGKLQKLSSSLYTYFLSVCINQSLKAINKKENNNSFITDEWNTELSQKEVISDKKINEIIQLTSSSTPLTKSPEREYEIKEMKRLVNKALNEMPSRCQDLLKSYYYDELNWSVIADLFDIKGGADSAKAQASRCREGFRERNQELKKLYNLNKRN